MQVSSIVNASPQAGLAGSRAGGQTGAARPLLRIVAAGGGLMGAWLAMTADIASEHACQSTAALASERPAAIGRIERSSGPARIARGGETPQVLPAVAAGDLVRGDQLTTGQSGRLSIQLHDGGRLVLGELTSVTIRELIVDLRAKTSAVLIELGRGIVRLTAATGERPHHSRSEVRTAAGTINAGGSDLVARFAEGRLSVLLLAGRIEVRNMAGVAVLDRARHGIEKVEAGHEPGRAYGWHLDRIGETLAEVTLP